jgi:hypothetical protein
MENIAQNSIEMSIIIITTTTIIVIVLQPLVGPWPIVFSFLILYTVGRTPKVSTYARNKTNTQ